MQPDVLLAALRAQAHGFYPAEAAVELLAGWNDGYWVRRMANSPRKHKVDYTDDPDIVGPTPIARPEWTALPGRLPASSGERAILAIAASIGGGKPVDLRDCLTSLGQHGIDCVIAAVAHAGGRRPAGF